MIHTSSISKLVLIVTGTVASVPQTSTSVLIGQIVRCHSNRHRTEAVHFLADDRTSSDSRGNIFVTGVAPDTGRTSGNLHHQIILECSADRSYTVVIIVLRTSADYGPLFGRTSTDDCCSPPPMTPRFTNTVRCSAIHGPILERCVMKGCNDKRCRASVETLVILKFNLFSPDKPHWCAQWLGHWPATWQIMFAFASLL
jgi:hypothetical protein